MSGRIQSAGTQRGARQDTCSLSPSKQQGEPCVHSRNKFKVHSKTVVRAEKKQGAVNGRPSLPHGPVGAGEGGGQQEESRGARSSPGGRDSSSG